MRQIQKQKEQVPGRSRQEEKAEADRLEQQRQETDRRQKELTKEGDRIEKKLDQLDEVIDEAFQERQKEN